MPAEPTQPNSDPDIDQPSDESAQLPEDLPPVKPPSAGFIVQLFLVPGLIVLVVVGVWALFGRMASSEQDWKVLVEELEQPNPNRRWRGAMGLAHLLQADQNRDDDGQRIAENPEVAKALAELLRTELKSKSNKETDLKQQAFLARTLGRLDVPDIVIPVLQLAMRPETDSQERTDLRKNAMWAVAVIAGRAAEKDKAAGEKFPGTRVKKLSEFPGLVNDLIELTNDESPLIRQFGTFALGLFPTDDSQTRLISLIDHSDKNTSINAAIALARRKSTKGLGVFKERLSDAGKEENMGPIITSEEQSASRYFWTGISAAVFLLTAVWAFGTTRKNSRMIAAVLCIGSISGLSYSIYNLVQNRVVDSESMANLGETTEDGPSFEERRKKSRAARSERLVVLQNCLKAVSTLSEELSFEEKTELLTLIEPIAEKHVESRIKIDAGKAILALKQSSAAE